ncbi:MAG: type II secretion system secretin GspD [Burkholderiales bacterium]|jgi:general secretion pathway protein D|nr:type II secretion system secretin GspD [Burkholderiales bacterium]
MAKRIFLVCASGFFLGSCATTEEPEFVDVSPRVTDALSATEAPFSRALAETADRVKTGADEPDRVKVFKGTGIMVKGQQAGGGVPIGGASAAQSRQPSKQKIENIVLNFEAADLREVIRNILGDILGEAYIIDPTVNGQVTIRSTSGLSGDALYATLETLLRMNNSTMIKENGVYKIIPAAAGVKGIVTPQLGNSQRPLPKGFSVQIVPLKYVSASEMMSILEPFAKDAQAMRADDTRNLIILSGTELELRHLMETIEMFDIDWMAGMSVGMFTLKYADVKSIGDELQTVFNSSSEASLFAGAARFIPIERLNVIMVITPRAEFLNEIKVWIDRLDDVGMGDTPRLYVYALKYARADRVAPLLQQAFTGRSSIGTTVTQPTLAPGVAGARTTTSTAAGRAVTTPRTTGTQTGRTTGTLGGASSAARTGTTAAQQQRTTATQQQRTTTAARGGIVSTAAGGMGIAKDIEVVADEDNNAILIVATPREYELVEQALKKLDVPQRQVMIEVTMAEVKLTEETKYGARWWFSSGDIFGGLGAISPLEAPGAIGQNMFNLVIKPGKTIDAIIDATGSKDNVKLVANPHIAALDNQEATIEVIDSLPIQSTYHYGSDSSNTSTSWNYLDVGVKLRITPHINEGGNVSLEAEIEFSGKGAKADEALDMGAAPQTTSRMISTQMMVPSGGTMVIGGLIRDDISDGSAGLPYLSRVPVLGGLFGSQSWSSTRTELVIFITPRVVNDNETRRTIIQDLRYRMDNLEGVLQKSKALPPDFAEELGAPPVWARPEDTKED